MQPRNLDSGIEYDEYMLHLQENEILVPAYFGETFVDDMVIIFVKCLYILVNDQRIGVHKVLEITRPKAFQR